MTYLKTIIFTISLITILFSCKNEQSSNFIPEGINRLESFKSDFVEDRNVDILLPENYYENEDQQYPVIYMHDGQMIFDPQLCWNQQSWEMDSISQQLVQTGDIKPAIIIGVWNTENRWAEFMPQDVFSYLDDADQKDEYKKVFSNDYLKFLAEELKPYIDENFRTKAEKETTFLMGSSMGGLISWYGVLKYPEVFGNAICISTHWPGVEPEYNHPLPPAIKAYFKDHLPEPGSHRFYFDFGTATLDKYYEPHQNEVNTILTEKNYSKPDDFLSMKFQGAEHSETAWKMRAHFPLMYMLKADPVTQ